MNLPNKLTLLRIMMIPAFVALVMLRAWPPAYLAACAVFSAAAFTDYLDGAIARKRGIVTDFGKFADPLADKILTTTAFIYMMLDGVCHPLVLVLILAREFAVAGVRMAAAGAPQSKVIAAGFWGKVKTVLQMLTVIFYYLAAGLQHLFPGPVPGGYFPQIASFILCWAVALLTVTSGIQYIWASRRYVNTAK